MSNYDQLLQFVAGNDKGNVTSLDEASISRFVLYHVGPDVQTFLGLDPTLNVFVKNVLTAHPECIFCKTMPAVVAGSDKNNDDDDDSEVCIEEILDEGDGMFQITTPRTLSGVSKWLNGFSNQELMQALATTYIVDGVETSALKEGIEGHVGQTVFSTYLLAEIASNVMNTNNQANAAIVGKPQCYDQMKACRDRTALDTFISNMSDNERSGCLLYLLYEKADNTVYIEALAPHVARLVPDDARRLMQLSAAEQLDTDNVNVLTNMSVPIAASLNTIMSMF